MTSSSTLIKTLWTVLYPRCFTVSICCDERPHTLPDIQYTKYGFLDFVLYFLCRSKLDLRSIPRLNIGLLEWTCGSLCYWGRVRTLKICAYIHCYNLRSCKILMLYQTASHGVKDRIANFDLSCVHRSRKGPEIQQELSCRCHPPQRHNILLR